jgi:outer membrane protein
MTRCSLRIRRNRAGLGGTAGRCRYLRTFGFAAIIALTGIRFASADTNKDEDFLPSWELGAGVGALYLADYRGSDEYRALAVPLPYFVYRGDRLRVDRDGIQGRLLGIDRARLDISVNGTLPVNDSENSARSGMPDLDPLIEIGPELRFLLHDYPRTHARLWLDLPLRAAFTVNLDNPEHAGWIANPRVRYRRDVPVPRGYWSLQLNAGLLFASSDYHEYFYGVPSEFATPDRPSYEAGGGYSGARIAFSTTRRIGKLWLGGGLRYDNLEGSAIRGSPLVTSTHSWAVFGGAAWVFAQGK